MDNEENPKVKRKELKRRMKAVIQIAEVLDQADVVFIAVNQDRIFKDIISVLKHGKKSTE